MIALRPEIVQRRFSFKGASRSKALLVQLQLPGRFGTTAFHRLLNSSNTAVNGIAENAASFLLIDDNSLTGDTFSARMVSLVCTK
jgi:hypothetical protein